MVANPIWIAGYGGTPTGGASPVWIVGYGGAIAGAAESWIAGYGGTPAAGASPVWVAGYGGTPTGGASPIWIGGYLTSGIGVLPGSPVNTVAPVASGALTVGSTLSCTTGTWTNSPTSYAYQWLRNGGGISGATSSTYVTVTADGGTSVSCRVTATNAIGPGLPATSNALAILGVPANTVAPVASGTLTVGSTLSVTNGTWTNSPASYAYQWQRGGTNISAATASTYVTVTADGGTSVGCLVTATNSSGSASQASNTLAIAAGGSTSVWSAADAAANGMTLTNGGLTVTAGPGSYQSVRGTNGQTTGKVYVEFAMTGGLINASIGDPAFGLASASFTPTNYLGASDYSMGCFSGAGGTIITQYQNFGSPSSAFVSNYTVGGIFSHVDDVWAMAVDLSSGKIWLAQNNVWIGGGNPSTGASPMATFIAPLLGQSYFPAMTLRNGASNTGVWTLQPTAASQTYAPPAGFSAWG